MWLHIITGVIALIGLMVFLAHYAVTVNSVPLWIIILAVVAMAGYDLAVTVRAGRNGDNGTNGKNSS